MTAEVITKTAPGTVAEVAARFRALLDAKQIRVFATIDQAEAARSAGLTLRDTILIIFGNPAAGTPIMSAAPLAALDLPLKLLIWDDNGTTRLTYEPPETLATRRNLTADSVTALNAIHQLTDALT
ncbi:hypothetical protein GCM10009630_15070 [Kribbella jejuensis]|uniref:Uncharacterized protein (DUF302 family) n=1 Tax=Kribbella jejuensis TaxID=236068 RepID=A0A542EAV3_9ACTN|nr:DUF302 domain-containing protein [Kribbella jejuensis]TQJ12445.1 uncharacterized protein (DUF302 family) [Kribbella jejuensis]